jgi:general secretion pathway protein C
MTARVYSLAAWVLLIGGVAATGTQLLRLALTVVGTNRLADAPIPEEPFIDAIADQGESLDILISAAPFGTSSRASASAWSDAATTDQMTLHAVRLADDKTESTATLSISGGPMDIYRIGEDIGGIGVVRHIEARRVMVEISGEHVLVQFPVPDRRNSLPPLYAAMAAEYSASPAAGGTGPLPASDGVANSIRIQMDSNPQVLIESFGLERAPDGYIVGPETPPILLAAGLKLGDKVVKVNGSQVGDAAADRLLFEQAVASGRARVEVLRGGQTLVLSFPLK